MHSSLHQEYSKWYQSASRQIEKEKNNVAMCNFLAFLPVLFFAQDQFKSFFSCKTSSPWRSYTWLWMNLAMFLMTWSLFFLPSASSLKNKYNFPWELKLYPNVAHLFPLIALTIALTRPPSMIDQSWWGSRNRTPYRSGDDLKVKLKIIDFLNVFVTCRTRM